MDKEEIVLTLPTNHGFIKGDIIDIEHTGGRRKKQYWKVIRLKSTTQVVCRRSSWFERSLHALRWKAREIKRSFLDKCRDLADFLGL